MKPYLAVNDRMPTQLLPLIKQEALLFDQITFVPYESSNLSLFSDISNELIWLLDNNIMIEVPPPKEWVEENADDLKRTRAHLKESQISLFGGEIDSTTFEEIISVLPTRTMAERASFVKNTRLAASYLTRMISTRLSKSGFEAYPILAREIVPIEESTKHHVVQIVLNGLPTPDDQTSWEQIVEFRSDPDSKSKFLDLRHWMSEMARADHTPAELEEKLEYLMSQYQRHMQLHKMKTNSGVLETTVVTTGEIVENLVNIKWGKLAKMLFSFRERKIALLEGELTSPGSEIAYMIKARERFNP
jgi:hypothetical protein